MRGWLRTTAALAVSLCLLAGGCSVFKQTPQTHRYMLPVPKAAVAIPANVNIRLLGVTGIAPFQDTAIACQTSAYQLDSYRYHRWVAPPTEMVADALRDIVQSPPPTGAAAEDVMMLSARINSFQETQSAGKHEGVVAIAFCLTPDRPFAPCQWRRTVAHESPVATDTPGAAVAAIAASYQQVMIDFASDLSTYLATLPAAKRGADGGRP